MHAVAQVPPDLAAAERLSQNVRLNAQLRTTCVATLISGGHAENALPQRAKATIQCRMLPGDSADNVQQLLVAALADPAIHITLDAPPIVSPESPPTPQIMKKVALLVHSMWPGVPIIPTMATGFSDDRQTRNAGMAELRHQRRLGATSMKIAPTDAMSASASKPSMKAWNSPIG